MVSSLGQLGMSSGDSPQNIYTVLLFFEPSDWLAGWLGSLGPAKVSRSGARQACSLGPAKLSRSGARVWVCEDIEACRHV